LAAFKVSPWDIDQQNTNVIPPCESGRSRAKGTSELVTSDANFSKLKEKEKKKRQKESSDSDERVQTRSATHADKRVLRSGSKSGSSSH
ncbi:unnamed protein product, partial [Allacma fusca]